MSSSLTDRRPPEEASAPEQLEQLPAEAIWQRALDEEPCWPLTILLSWSLMLMLVASVGVPLAVDQPSRMGWTRVLLAAVLMAPFLRVLFETGAFMLPHRRAARALAAAASAACGAGLAYVAATIGALACSLPTAAAIAGASFVTLLAAATLRELEIRLRLSQRRVYFVGDPVAGQDLALQLVKRRDATLVGSFPGDRPAPGLVEEVISSRATLLVLDATAMRSEAFVAAASRLNLAGLRVRDLTSYYESEFKKVPLSELSPTWFLFDIASIHRRVGYRIISGLAEILIALVLLVLASPILLACMVAIRLTSPGPALYRQRRVGRGGVPFTLVKLRTMRCDDSASAAWAGSHSHRVTPVGRWLRRFRLDELPQLWNVLRGELALVGPRPEQVPIAERLDRELPYYSARHAVRPGITGWAQVSLGYAGSPDGTVAKLQRDLYYVKHASLRLDALILWLSVKAVLAARG